MESTHPLASDGASLTGVVHGVRDRWRLKRALRGASIVLAAAFVLLAGSAYILDKLHYGHTALVVTRGIVLLIVAVLAAVFVGVPLLPRRQPSDRRVALYLEEHAPSLDAAVLTAVELQEREATADAGDAIRTRRPVSSTLLTHLIAHVCDLEVGDFIHTFGDLHIYSNHLEQVEELLKREPMPLPNPMIVVATSSVA